MSNWQEYEQLTAALSKNLLSRAQKKDVVAILVSTKNATRPAKKFAQAHGIDLAVVSNLNEYSIRFGSDHFAGMSERVSAVDTVEAQVIRAKSHS
jgi:ABC-type Zn uptake system ZnuABC Zn-binding protein ZnuA